MDEATTPPVDADSAAPKSNLTCATFQSYWVAGHQGPFVVKHVENCDHCLRILFGDGETWKLSIEEEAEQELANERRTMRRRFVFAAAAGVMAIVAGGWGFTRISANRNTTTTVGNFYPQQAVSLARLDQAMSKSGAPAIRAILVGANIEDTALTFRWIADRQHASLYGDLISGIGDPRIDAKLAAISNLWLVPRPALKPHLGTIGAFQVAEPDPTLKTELADLITAITKS